MNFVYISPSFPKNFYNFCDCLKKRGVVVLAIGDTPYEELSVELRNSINDYYQVSSLENYDEMVRAMGYFIFHYGRIDWLESNNEYWLDQDARLRTDFHIATGLQTSMMEEVKCKSLMKSFYEQAHVKTARYHLVSQREEGKKFVKEVGYPVIVKPDNGVGASQTYKLENDQDLEWFYQQDLKNPYIMEEFVDGLLISYDGIANLNKDILFETSHVFPNQIMDVVNNNTSMCYYSLREIPEALRQCGQACVKTFHTAGRCFHMEFFQLYEDKKGLGKKGDYIGLEVNLRTPGGYTPDMMNFANDIDIYDIYADMITKGQSDYQTSRPYYCVYCGRRDHHPYSHSHNDVMSRYQWDLLMCERMPEILSGAMGNDMYVARFETMDEVNDFVKYTLK